MPHQHRRLEHDTNSNGTYPNTQSLPGLPTWRAGYTRSNIGGRAPPTCFVNNNRNRFIQTSFLTFRLLPLVEPKHGATSKRKERVNLPTPQYIYQTEISCNCLKQHRPMPLVFCQIGFRFYRLVQFRQAFRESKPHCLFLKLHPRSRSAIFHSRRHALRKIKQKNV